MNIHLPAMCRDSSSSLWDVREKKGAQARTHLSKYGAQAGPGVRIQTRSVPQMIKIWSITGWCCIEFVVDWAMFFCGKKKNKKTLSDSNEQFLDSYHSGYFSLCPVWREQFSKYVTGWWTCARATVPRSVLGLCVYKIITWATDKIIGKLK